MEQTDDYFEIKVTHRSLGAGLNEIFVDSDEECIPHRNSSRYCFLSWGNLLKRQIKN